MFYLFLVHHSNLAINFNLTAFDKCFIAFSFYLHIPFIAITRRAVEELTAAIYDYFM
jgi:hypothetical protein